MAKFEILHYPDPRLRNKARPVEHVDNNISKFVDELLETMYAAPGVGLAATQVNVAKQIVVIDLSENKDQPLCLINPQILQASGKEETEEGCLSVPGVYAPVTRAAVIEVRALNKQGEPFEMEAEGILAVCIQHELDHLEGKLFVDYLSKLKKQRIKKKLEKKAQVTL
jgi:peptide deformylase